MHQLREGTARLRDGTQRLEAALLAPPPDEAARLAALLAAEPAAPPPPARAEAHVRRLMIKELPVRQQVWILMVRAAPRAPRPRTFSCRARRALAAFFPRPPCAHGLAAAPPRLPPAGQPAL